MKTACSARVSGRQMDIKHDLAIGSFTTNRQFEIMSTEGRHEEAKDEES